MKTIAILLSCFLIGAHAVLAQGFVNLNFENAHITGTVFNTIPATNAFPGWTVIAPYVFYNDQSLSGGSISIFDTNQTISSFPPLQGKYFVLLVGSGNLQYGAISIGQSGLERIK
jgi:hypothetical protein